MYKIYRIGLKLSPVQLCLFSVIARIIASSILGILVYLLQIDVNTNVGPFKKSYTFSTFFSAVVIVPLFETLVFQTLPILLSIHFAKGKIRHYHAMAAIISAFIFGLTHYYSLLYVVHTFLIGIVLAWAYIFAMRTRKNAFMIVTMAHAIMNCFTFLIKYFSVD